MEYKLACADFTFPLLSHEASLSLISMLGFDGVDIGLFEGRSHLWPSVEFERDTGARELGAKLAERNLGIADLFLQLDPDFHLCAINHPEPKTRKAARDQFRSALDYAAILGCRHLTILPGVVFDSESPSTSLGRAYDELAWRLDLAAEYQIVFAVEAHVGSIVPRPKSALSLLKKIPGLTLTLDYTHFTKLGIPDTEVESLLPYASHFHARGARKGRLQASFTDNTIDYARVVDRLRELDYSGYLGIEYVWLDWEHCNEVDNISETVLFRDYLSSL